MEGDQEGHNKPGSDPYADLRLEIRSPSSPLEAWETPLQMEMSFTKGDFCLVFRVSPLSVVS